MAKILSYVGRDQPSQTNPAALQAHYGVSFHLFSPENLSKVGVTLLDRLKSGVYSAVAPCHGHDSTVGAVGTLPGQQAKSWLFQQAWNARSEPYMPTGDQSITMVSKSM